MHTHRRIWIIAFIIVAAGFGFVLYRANETPREDDTSPAESGVSCYQNTNYFVLSRSAAGGMGTDFLVKNKTSPTQVIPCVYHADASDFEIKNQDAEYFLALTDNFLILDSGTAPEPRGLIVYDMRARAKTFTDKYARPVMTSAGDMLSYWTPTDEKVSSSNCPAFASYTASGLGALIESHVELALPSREKHDLGEERCVATQ